MLPSDRDPIRPPMAYKLSIGETRTKDGKTFPAKQDYFTIRRFSAQSGQSATYIVDDTLQKLLCDAVGVQEKPRVVPVSVIGNPFLRPDGRPDLPPSILWSRMAYYWGGRCVCSCGDFDDEGRGKATRKEWEAVTKGEGDKARTVHRVKSEQELVCDPKVCPWATGMHTMQRYFGTALCKPQIMASFVLPFAPMVGSVAVLKTTGWHTYRALRNGLLTIAESTQGWLHRLPLQLVYGYGRASDGKLVPELRIEYPGAEEKLLSAAADVKQRYLSATGDIKRLEAGVVETIVADLGNPEAEVAWQSEFMPEGAGADVTEAVEAEFVPDNASEPDFADDPGEPTEEEQQRIRAAEAEEYRQMTLAEEGEPA